MNKLILSSMLVLSLTACGGGGGGGSGDKHSPSRTNVSPNPGGGQPQNLQTGIFTDSPVSGLRFRQGEIQGITDAEGRFTYDANSDTKVEFLISNVSIGFADGAPAVTPFDLQASSDGVNYNRGINVSRFLMSMDTDSNPANGIELSPDLKDFTGSFPFDMQPSEFGQDSQVTRMLPLYGVLQLVSENDVQDHLSENDVIVQQLNNARTQLDALGNVQVRWNPGLDGAGVLADLQAENGERMFIIVDGAAPLYVSSIIYLDAIGRYSFVTYDNNGIPTSTNINGTVIQSLPLNNSPNLAHQILMLDLPNYKKPLTHALVNTTSGNVTFHEGNTTYSQVAAGFMRKLVEEVATDNDLLDLAANLLQDAQRARCKQNPQCNAHSILPHSLQQSLADARYQEQRYTLSRVGTDSLSLANVCVAISAVEDGSVCGSSVRLSNLIALFGSHTSNSVTAWKARNTVPQASGIFYSRLSFSTHEDGEHNHPEDLPANSSHLPSPWIWGGVRFEFEVTTIKLTDNMFFTTMNFLRTTQPLTFVECEYWQESGAEPYKAGCRYGMTEINTPERRAFSDTISDVLRLADGYSALLYRYDHTSVHFDSYPLDMVEINSVYPRAEEATQAELVDFVTQLDNTQGSVASKLLADISRHFKYQSNLDASNQYQESPSTANWKVDQFRQNIGMADSSRTGTFPHLGFSLRGVQIDPRIRLGRAYIEFDVFCDRAAQSNGCYAQ